MFIWGDFRQKWVTQGRLKFHLVAYRSVFFIFYLINYRAQEPKKEVKTKREEKKEESSSSDEDSDEEEEERKAPNQLLMEVNIVNKTT